MDLLAKILQEIEAAGGRYRMGYIITNKEAPEWFNHETKKHFQWRVGSRMYILNRNLINKSKRTWTDEQLKYVKANWKKFSVEYIAKSIGKSVSAVKFKARHNMTSEEYENRFYNRTKAGLIYKEKSKNWKRYKK